MRPRGSAGKATDSRKSRYDAKEIAGKVLKVESIGALGC
jgi:hypothetical protein